MIRWAGVKHCKHCDLCITEQYKHSALAGKCIGIKNHDLYFYTLGATLLTTIYMGFGLVYFIVLGNQ